MDGVHDMGGRTEHFGPLKTLDASLDEDGRKKLSQAWVDFTETMRENDEIVHRREYLLIVGTRR